MRVEDFKAALVSSISDDEWLELADFDSPLIISEFNRKNLLNMRSDNSAGYFVPEDKANELYHTLQVYLDKYMPEKQGHKWIILACLYRTYVLRKPMHPQKAAGYKEYKVNGVTSYVCPLRSDEPGSVCLFCVCK